MAKETPPKRVFILGAGFSKAAGMPLAVELTEALLAHGHMLDNDDFRGWIEDIRKRVGALEGDPGAALNIEQLFEFARFDREWWLMRQQECIVGRHYGETPHSTAEAISAWLSYLEDGLVQVLVDKERSSDAAKLDAFIGELNAADTILTFNYDTLAERSIANAGKIWSHGFAAEPSEGLRILKLHGSIDWWLVPRGYRCKDLTTLFAKRDDNVTENQRPEEELEEWEYRFVLHRAPNLDYVAKINEPYIGLSRGEPARPGLGGLGSHKPLHKLVGSGVVWRNAFQALRGADEVYVIGWSASPFDVMARFYFCSVLNLREAAPDRVVVVDLNAESDRTNYEAVFGRIIPVPKKVENVDWSTLLAQR